jgi:hypothetical protein
MAFRASERMGESATRVAIQGEKGRNSMKQKWQPKIEEAKCTRRIVNFGRATYAVVERISNIDGKKETDILIHKLAIPWAQMERKLEKGPSGVEAQ